MSTTRVVKRKARGFFKQEDITVIKDAVQTCNDIMTNTSILVRYYYLKWFQEHHPLLDDAITLELTKEHFTIASKVIQGATSICIRSKTNSDVKSTKQHIFDEMYVSFREMYCRLPGNHIVNSKYSLSHVLQYSIDNLLTSYKTNITTHFPKYPKRYITCDLLQKGLDYKEAKKVAWKIIQNYFYDEPIDDTVVKNLIDSYEFLFPKKQNTDKPRCWDICVNPWIYLYKMVMINQSLETEFPMLSNKYRKLYNPLPFHSTFVPMHIRLDTSGISQLLMNNERIKLFKEIYEAEQNVSLNMSSKADMLSSFKKLFGREATSKKEEGHYATSLWSFITNLQTCRQWHDINHSNQDTEWVFDNAVVTDGVSISFQVTKEEIFGRKAFGRKKKKQNDNEDIEQNVEEEIKRSKKRKAKQQPTNAEVTKKNKILGCDPGKRDILTITDGYKTIRYTKGQRDQDTYNKIRRNVTLKKKRKENLETFETQIMNKYSKRSCIPMVFSRYVCSRKRKEQEFRILYSHTVFRQFKFTSYVKTKSSEDRFKDKVFKTFSPSNVDTFGSCGNHAMISNARKSVASSKDIVIGWGNWGKSPNALKGVGSTPGIGIRTRFNSVFKTVTVDEHMTSKTCSCCKNVTLKVHNKHHLLRCTNDECRSRWWNRNVVGSFNILQRYLKIIYPEIETSGNG